MATFKDNILFGSDSFFRAYIRYFPIPVGKSFLWNRIIEPYISWRNREVTAKTNEGIPMKLHLPDFVQSYIYYFGVWEPNLTNYILRALRPGDCLIDVGANVGYYTLLGAKSIGESGKVHAIEASPMICSLLRNNLELNDYENITVHNLAVSDKISSLEIFNAQNSQNLGATTTRRIRAGARGYQSEGRVDAAPIDQIVPRDDLLNARIIKIDVEGAETQVIQGMSHLMKKFSDNTEIIVELNREEIEESGETVDAILELFRQSGFHVYQLPNDYSAYPYLQRSPISLPKKLIKTDFEQIDVIFSKRQTLGT
jgi:FkbM family methyltransferase